MQRKAKKTNQRAIALLEPRPGMTYSIDQVARITHTSRRTIAVYCRMGILSPIENPTEEGWHFDDEAIRIMNKAELLRANHDLNLTGVRMIMHLSAEVERLHAEIRFLRQAK